jgi:hypothetical protein
VEKAELLLNYWLLWCSRKKVDCYFVDEEQSKGWGCCCDKWLVSTSNKDEETMPVVAALYGSGHTIICQLQVVVNNLLAGSFLGLA